MHGDAEHHFGLTGARRCLEEKLERAGRKVARDRFDRRFLIDRQRERFVRLDQFVRAGDEIFVFFDLLPDGGGA